jgi:tetratricopeptide (TPR) repeat protein
VIMAKPGADSASLGQSIAQALAFHQQGRLDEAEKIYTRVLKAQRDNFDAMHLLGMLNYQRGKTGEAYRLLIGALKLQPRSPDAMSNLALVLHILKRSDEALAHLDKALALAPNHSDALNNRGNVLLDLKRPAEALSAFEAVLTQQPRHLQARINRGNALTELGRPAEALSDYGLALSMAPGHPLALYNRGNALRMLGREHDAIAAYDGALAAIPGHLNAWLNRGFALAAMNRHQDAVASYGRILALAPDHADAHFNAALSLLTLGDYERGFSEYEWRWKRTGMTAHKDFRHRPWLGETPLNGKTILLHAEQGLGDTVQFVRYVPLLVRQGARVVLEVPPELQTLLKGLDGVSEIIVRGGTLPPYDVHCPLGSLPLACQTAVSAVPAEIPYLTVPRAYLDKWRPKLQSLPGRAVALAWSGRATHSNDRNRSLAFPDLAPLLSVPGVTFISVQRDVRPADEADVARETRIHHLGGELDDFADTAAVLALADFTISVDTSVAHVAGALGRPGAVLLPFQPDWRWMLDRESSPWYPRLRLLRQPRPGDWTTVLDQATEMLASRGGTAT